MGWRKIQKEDIQRGVVIRMTSMLEHGSYSMATIISIDKAEDKMWPSVTIARPYAYANLEFDSRHPLLGAEVFGIGVDRMLSPTSDVEVYQGQSLAKMVT